MSGYRTSRSWGGWFIACCLSLGLAGVTVMVIQKRLVEAAIPSLLTALYVVAVVGKNRTEAEVGPEGVEVWYGPLPTGEKGFRIPREEIVEVYVRRVEVSGRPNKRVWWQAGVETRAGERVDIGGSGDAEAEARAMVAALGWKQGIDRSDRGPGKTRGMAFRLLMRLGVMAGVCVWWATRY